LKRYTADEALKLYERLNAHPPLTLVLAPALVFVLIAQCQLALRHPNNHGPGAEQARQWIEEVARYLDGLVPGVYDLVQMGFETRFDQPVDDG